VITQEAGVVRTVAEFQHHPLG